MARTVTLILGPGGCGKTHELSARVAAHDGEAVLVQGTALAPAPDVSRLGQLGSDALVAVDDAQFLDDETLAMIAAIGDDGPDLAVAHRPSTRPAVAALDRVLGACGDVVRLGPLGEADLAALLAVRRGKAVDQDELVAIRAATGGVPAWALAIEERLLPDDLDAAGDALAGPVELELARAGPEVTAIAHVAALAPQLPDDVIGAATETDAGTVRAAFDELGGGGLLDPEAGTLWPAVRVAVRSLVSTARRRHLHERIAVAVVERGGEVVDAAEHLLQSGATGPEASALFARAGDELRFRSPTEALDWYAEASAASALSIEEWVGEVEAEAFAGRPIRSRTPPGELSPALRQRLLAIRAVDEAREAQPERSAAILQTVADAEVGGGPLTADAARFLSVAMRLAAPTSEDEGTAGIVAPLDPLDAAADMAHRLAVACRGHLHDPDGSPARFTDAADAFERLEPAFVVPDSPHALGALHLSAAGDHRGASLLLGRADACSASAPLLAARHRLLRAWVDLRAGRYEAAVSVLREPPPHHDIRDRVVFAAIGAGVARRNGDIARLRDAWAGAEPLLLAATPDRFHVEVVGELVLAAARMRETERAAPVLATLDAVAGAEGAGAWRPPIAWLQVQLGIENDDPAAVEAAAGRLEAVSGQRPHDTALCAAAFAWSGVLAGGDNDNLVAQVADAASGLASRGLPWEASRLAGQAAIRVTDAAAARRLLEQARQLHRVTEGTEPTPASDAGLSERELEIAQLVVEGLTHREVGAQLYISPKTVEHHVANIRRKVQAESRAEMLAILKGLVPPAGV